MLPLHPSSKYVLGFEYNIVNLSSLYNFLK
jgi:hypothetical protein